MTLISSSIDGYVDGQTVAPSLPEESVASLTDMLTPTTA
jgi:hypothetical protein